MNFYAFIPRPDGSEPLGSSGKLIIRDLKTLKGVINRINTLPYWVKCGFVVNTFGDNFYNEREFKTVHVQPAKN